MIGETLLFEKKFNELIEQNKEIIKLLKEINNNIVLRWMRMKLEGGGLTRFKEIIEDFVNENFEVTGLCRGCSDNGEGIVMPYDYKGSYEKAIKELFEVLKWIKNKN